MGDKGFRVCPVRYSFFVMRFLIMKKIIYSLLISSYVMASPLFAMVPNPLEDGSSQTSKTTLPKKNPSDEDSDGEDSDENKDDVLSIIKASVSTGYNMFSSFFSSKEEKTIIPPTKSYFSLLHFDQKLHICSFLNQHDMLNLCATSKDLLKMRLGIGVKMQEIPGNNQPSMFSSSLASLISQGGDKDSASSIHSLYFFPANLSNKDLEPLSSFPNLRTLGLQSCHVQNLPNLNNLTNLRSLKLGAIETGNDKLQCFSPLTNLTSLDLHDIYDFADDRLQYSSRFPNLKLLRLSAKEMGDFSKYILSSLSRLQNLTSLEMGVNKSSGDFHLNCNLPPHLTSLKMDISKISGALHLSNLTNLKLLQFDAKELEGDSRRLGLSLPTSLQSLECDFPLLGQSKLDWLCPLTNLTSLKLKRQDIDYLARAVLHHLTNLTELDVLPFVISEFRYTILDERLIIINGNDFGIGDTSINLQKFPQLKQINDSNISCFRRQNRTLGKDDISRLQSQMRPRREN